jgi:hypothetical protein
MLGYGRSSKKCLPDGLDNYESIAKLLTPSLGGYLISAAAAQ